MFESSVEQEQRILTMPGKGQELGPNRSDYENRSSLRPRLDRWAIPAFLFVLAFLPRALYPVSRAWLWYLRSVRFWDALLAGDWAYTYQQYHPGVTTMWLSGLALKLFAWHKGLTSEQLLRVAPAKPGTFDAAATVGVLPIAFVVSLCIALSYVLLKRLTDRQIAFVGSFCLALDPILIAYSKQIHLNALLAAFMWMSVLFLLCYLEHKRPSSLVWSGVFAGLSFLTKSPAVFLVPYALLTLAMSRLAVPQSELRGWIRSQSVGRQGSEPGAEGPTPLGRGLERFRDRLWVSRSLRSLVKSLRADLVSLLIWGGVAAAVFVLLWPAMWVDPLAVLRGVGERALFHVETAHPNPVFFNNRVTTEDPGLLFYVATIGWKTTLVTLPMAGLALVLALRKPRQARYSLLAWLLLAYAVFFTVQMGLASKKQMSYILPAFAAVDILAALGLVQGVQAISRVLSGRDLRLGGLSRWLPATLTGLALALQTGVTLSRHPYYDTHHNALLGGSRIAQHILPLQEEGEGLDLAAEYLNAQPRAQYSGVWIQARSSLAFERKYEGLTANVPDARATYRVYYVNQVMRGFGDSEWEEAWEADRQAPPLWTVSFDGIPYVWVYGSPPEEPAAGGPQYAVDYRVGDHIRLTGYRLSAERVSPGDTLTVVLFWQSDGQVQVDYTVFCHLVSARSELVAQHDGKPVLAIRPTPSWRAGEVMYDSHPIVLSPDLAPGEYELSVGMYDLETLERAPAFDSVGQRLPQDRIVLSTVQVQ